MNTKMSRKKYKVFDGKTNQEIRIPRYIEKYLNSVKYTPGSIHTNIFQNIKLKRSGSGSEYDGVVVLMIKNEESVYFNSNQTSLRKLKEVIDQSYDFYQYREIPITGGVFKGWYWVQDLKRLYMSNRIYP
jgi:hypothetical protein